MNKLQEPQNKGSQAQEKPTFIMLAAGNSRRFGSNKLLYEIGGVPMYLRTLHKLQKAASELGNCEIIVVTQYEEIEQAARSLGVNVYINPHPDEGISSSLKIGLKANLDVDACLFTVSDQPWLTIATIRQLITLLKTSGKGIACVSCEGKLGNPCIFTKKYYDSLLSINGDKGGKAVITAHRDDTVVLKVNDVKELTDMDVKL